MKKSLGILVVAVAAVMAAVGGILALRGAVAQPLKGRLALRCRALRARTD